MLAARSPSLILGTRGIFPLLRYFRLNKHLIQSHKHIQGVSGSGKSYLLAKTYVDLVTRCGIPAALIDPHGDLAHDALRLLVDTGYFSRPDAYKKLWYVDFTRSDRFVPFNVLSLPYEVTTIAAHIVESFERAYPAMADGAAPQFENVMQFTAVVLASNKLPITEATNLLTNKDYRERLLQQTAHSPTHEFFHNRYDRWGKDQQGNIESTLNKISNLTFTDTMRFSLGQRANILDFQKLINEGVSVIFNIHLDNQRAQKLLGCLLTTLFEAAALSRTDNRSQYHLIIDEAFSFSTSKGEAFSRLLSQARKFNFYLWMAHQTWDQLPESLRTSVQNMAVEIYFGLGYDDAQLIAPRIGKYNPMEVKHEVKDEKQVDRTHPLYSQMMEQWERMARGLENLHQQEAYVKVKRKLPRWKQLFLRPYKTVKIRSLTVPKQRCSNDALQKIKEYYAHTLLKPKHEIENLLKSSFLPPLQPQQVISRRFPISPS